MGQACRPRRGTRLTALGVGAGGGTQLGLGDSGVWGSGAVLTALSWGTVVCGGVGLS